MIRTIALASVALFLFAGVSTASAGPTQLSLPQGAALAILGASCGGIQEQNYAAGFDATTGYPFGFTYLSTRCGGSGRGGGYKVTTHTAWAAVTWDYTGAVVSSARTSSATANGTLAIYDRFGNEVYNASGAAYLALAPGFVPPPRFISLSPATGPASGGTTVTITGAGFVGVTAVRFGGVAAGSFTVTSPTSLTAVAPASSAGTVDVAVVNGGGASPALPADRFTFVAAPVVTGISPKSGPVAGGTTVTITGSHFTGVTAVSFGGVRTYSYTTDSDTSITVVAPAAEATDTVDVTVSSAGGGSAVTTADRYSYTATRPVVSFVDPASGASSGGTTVTLAGSGFSRATRVTFGGVSAAFSVQSDSSLVAVSPGGTGTVDVVVTDPAGSSIASASDQFTYVAPPTIAGVAPGSGPTSGGTLVTITGSGFSGVGEVDFGGVSAQFVVNDDTSITALLPSGAAGTVDVAVGSTTAAGAFTYVDPPAVSGISPGSGPTAGGNEVTITGGGFSTAYEVDFGGVAGSFTVVDDSTITATAPAGAIGPVDVTVVAVGGTSAVSGGDVYTYQ